MGEAKRKRERSPCGPRHVRCRRCGGKVRDEGHAVRLKDGPTRKLACESCGEPWEAGPCATCLYNEALLCGHPAAEGDREFDIDSTCMAWQAKKTDDWSGEA